MSNEALNGEPAVEVLEVLSRVSLLHQAFELLAAAEPGAEVMVAGFERITRGELEARANRLARFLVREGVGPEVRVAIMAERTPALVVAMYAVLKAGGAYVPVDPAYPEQRQEGILGDSGALLLLTEEPLVRRVPQTSARHLLLDRDAARIALESTEPLPLRAEESNLAYVIYTSGSTGRPKGVAIAHRSAVVLTRWAARVYSPEELSGVLGSTSVCFDMSIFELFVAPALGGRVILAANALALPELPAAGEVTLVNTVPSAAAELVRQGGLPPSVATLNLGGEALRAALVNRLYATGTVRKVYNVYGPSEDTTFSTWALSRPGDAVPSIGVLLDGSWGYLVDRELARVAAAEPGELYIGGEGLARGYLGRPDLTAERFVPDPHSGLPGARMYATGDLIRDRPDGELDYLGRLDHQVKVRGFRVELGEIEAALERHPAVADTVVVALDLDAGGGEVAENSLVAYVVLRAEGTSVPELREHLRGQLPDYMVPSYFVVLEALPLNPNGKVDRKALPRPEVALEAADARPGAQAPRTPLETVLAGIWSEVLGVSGVGIHDDFFELGGHSLLAARALARVHEVLGRRLPPRALFEAPTVESLAAWLTDLPEAEELEGPLPSAGEARWVASSGQEAIWVSERLSLGLALFTVPLRLDLVGPLDRNALHRALAVVVRRHEALRVSFHEVAGRFTPRPSTVTVGLTGIDLDALPVDLREQESERLADVLGRQPVDLQRGPMLHGTLVRLADGQHRLVLILHHIVCDDWSIWLLAQELAALYAAETTGQASGLPPLSLGFFDYAAWQQSWLLGAEAQRQLDYWRGHLDEAPPLLELPTDRPRPPVQSFRGAQLFDLLSLTLSRDLLKLALERGATHFMAFLAGLFALFHRYSGQRSIVIGSPMANRHRPGTQGLIGLFTNNVSLRADLGADPSFGELLGQVRKVVLGALGHQDFPFEHLVREMKVERTLSHSPIAQVNLSFQNTPPLPSHLGDGLALRLHELGNSTAKDDMTVYLRQEGGALLSVWEYATDLFDRATIARLSSHLHRLFEGAIADPSRRVSSLPLLSEAEEAQAALAEGSWNPAWPSRVALVPERIADRMRRSPEEPAVRFEGESLTFAALDRRTGALAAALRRLGVRAEDRVAILVERSLAMVVAPLGVLKAGAGYVPLDVESPRERLGHLLDDCGARVLIAQEGPLPPFDGPVLRLTAGGDLAGVALFPKAPWAAVEPGHLAYVIYTSGSTGRPKGVMVEHGHLASYLGGVLERLALPDGASYATVSTLAADLGNTVLFASLATGGCLDVLSRERLSDASSLARYFEAYPVEGLKIVPSHLAALLASPWPERCLPRRLLILGGESLPPALLTRVRELAPGCRVLNHYGPTETTVGVLTYEVPADAVPDRVPLGKPLAHARVLILDRSLARVPALVPGEIHIGGAQVSRGYLGNPDRTAERFLPDPWSGVDAPPGGRLYATGDLGRRRPDGAVEFLGRLDLQVKIRGFRVEPGEVEAALRSHPAVADAAVVARDQRLTAYVVAKPGSEEADGPILRAFLRERLPDPLVPSSWVLLPALPLNPNGKVNRRALPLPESRPISPWEGPRSVAEESLAAIWADLLGIEGIGIHESFFELGGHSLLAMQVVSRIRDTFGVELPLSQLFETPTLVALAPRVEAALRLAAPSGDEPRGLHEAFAAWAARAPEAVAVLSASGVPWTYGEIEHRSDQLARRLARLGVTLETPVGVCLPRSPELVVVLLAVLKVGGTYLPLDPAYPEERLAFMLEDSGAGVALAEIDRPFPQGPWQRWSLEALETLGDFEEVSLEPVPPESLAYLIYTSGSTGRPKGVGVSHGAAAAHLEGCAREYGLLETDRLLSFSSPSFDASLEEILAPFTRGAAVVLRGSELESPAELLGQIARLGVTVVDLPTAYWHAWTAECGDADLPEDLALRLVICGGEAMSAEAARRWWRSPLAGVRLLNAYGPTEGVITATVQIVDAATAAAATGAVPLGRLLPGRSSWLLDERGLPVATGQEGELVLGGVLLARGYLGRPDLTAERFVPDPFAGAPGSRLYRTGDLARRHPDGVLEFLGRADRQLKVRGFRVEPEEVESALEGAPGVRRAVVDVRTDAGGSQRLVAWIVPADPADPPQDLAGFLRGHLPAHFVPSAFVTLPSLPITPAGKVSYGDLPAPESLETGPPDLPEGAGVLGELRELWRELLGVSPIGPEDDFFALGGHSLLAVRLVSRLRDVFGVEIPLRAMFQASSLGRLADRVEEALAESRPIPAPFLEPVGRPEHPPLSYSQRSLWFLDRLQPLSDAYNLPTALDLRGPLDVSALRSALAVLVARHEALRTRFPETGGEPWQEVLPPFLPDLPVLDLEALPAAAKAEEARRLIREEAGRPFDLASGPLVRARLVRLSPTEHQWLLALHHIVSDGWSDVILIRELSTLYGAEEAGRRAELPALPLQAADYAIWEQKALQGAALEESLAVWLRRLEGVPPLDLPTDRLRPPTWSYRGDLRSRRLGVPAGELERRAREEEVTSFMLLLAALQALLGRFADQEDFAVGTPTANRTRSELEGVVGFFVNMLPLRADLSGAPSLREVTARVRATALEAFTHQHVPFELMVENLAPERDLGRNPVFQVAFQLQHGEEPGFAGLAVSWLPVERPSAKFDLNVHVESRQGGLHLSCEYGTDLFEPATVDRLLGQLDVLLTAGLAAPERSWRDLPLLTASEEAELLFGLNDTGSTSGTEATLHGLFEAQVAEAPDRVALVAAGERLTYGQLDQRAERLAGRLRALGLGPERLAGVLLSRTADLIVALLAVLKTGGAYAPLDPKYPRQRLLLMLETARAALLVTSRDLAGLAGVPADGPAVLLVDEPADTASPPASTTVLPGNLAYLIFTSGSTGVPKGVAIEHRSAVAMVRWAHSFFTPADYQGVLASTSICFDMSVFEIFATLAAGGKVILADNALALPHLAARDEVVLIDTVPSAMAELVRLGRLPDSVRTVNLGGEALKGSLVAEIHAALPNVERVVNLYGPSEDTTFSTFAVVPRGCDHPLIGRPLTGEAAYVLDRGLRPVPFGVPGALYLGGEGVTRGYLGRPDLTAERFLPNPFGPPGSRMYQVGDLVRYRSTGELDFLGRLDYQVKVRGFRVELGEIESALARHPEVQEAAVLAFPDEYGGYRLAAFVAAGRELAAGELRSWLQRDLPDFMIPGAFATLGALPLTPNGKIDRRALAEIETRTESEAADARAPRSFTEEVLVGIWSDLFARPVAVNDGFFDLGGHSLLATRVVSRIRDAFGVELPVRLLFERPTVAELAPSVEAALGVGAGAAEPIQPAPRTGRLPLSFAQSRLWFLDQLDPGSSVYNLPEPLEITGPLDVAVLRTALDELVRRHESLRTVFPGTDGEPYQEIGAAGAVPLPLVDLSGLADASEEAEARVAEGSRRPFDLATGPLFRTTLLRLAPERHVLLLALHHIVTDGWSMDVLLRDLLALYEAFAAGRPSPLPEPAVQYADFSVWQRRRLQGETLSRQLDYWRGRLAGAPSGLDLPTDFPRPAVQSLRGASVEAGFSPELSEALRAFCRREGVTLFMLLLAGFDVLLARYSGQEDLLVGSPVANRDWVETEGLIGFFVNTLVLRADLGEAESFRDLLGQVREISLAAYGHQDLPFETLVEELKPDRDLSRSPFFQVMLLVQPARHALPVPPGLAVAPLALPSSTSKFDLTLAVLDRGDALWAEVEHSTALFETATAARLLGHLERLLAAAVAHPKESWRDLPLLTAGEREQLLVGFNETEHTVGPDLCLHQLFEAQAAWTPERVAVVAPDRSLTYAQLDHEADRLAGHLRALGLGPERLAGVLMDRTADLIVALLAVLKAGGAYAPLDPNYPQSRVLLMLETARARVLLTRRHLAEGLPEGFETVFLDEPLAPAFAAGQVPVLPGNLAYVIFTSGSTGVPKGVAIEHRSAVAMVRWALGFFGPDEYGGLLASTSICFDMSVFEIFATLATGGRILLADNALALPELAARDEVVLIDTVPSAMAELLRSEALPASVRTVNLGGEALKGSLVREIYERLPNVERVVNLYGPSEDTTFTSYSVVPRDAAHPLIGRPLTGETFYVLDSEMRPVPLGVPGALYVGGEGVTRGYLHRPELTAERYVPNPYGPPGSRLYTVGDLVRYLPSGELDFLGRLDHQVKVRGFRIELGEIEAALTRFPGVREAAVLAFPDDLGGNRLVAYLAAEPGLLPADLRSFLKQTLPDYMVPSAFVTLPALPLTPNGKLDRRALAQVSLEPEVVETGRAPRGPVEETLVALWSEVFGRPVQVDDNFFDLGGHSLIATRVVSRARGTFGIEIPVRRLFEHPTVESLARAVEAELGGRPARPGLDAIAPAPRTEPLPLSFAQRRLWFLDQLLPGTAVYNIPEPLGLEGDLDVHVLRRALDEIVRRHEALRTVFPEADGEPYQEILPAGPVPLLLVDLEAAPEDAEEHIQAESQRPFDLQTGPLLRAVLYRLAPRRHVLLLTLHHIVADGWSLEVLVRELSALYEAFQAGRPSPLPELSTQYADFAVWQLRWLQGDELARQVDYWRGQLAGAPAGLDLPADHPRPAVQTFAGATRSAVLPARLSDDLRAYARQEGVTPFMLFLAAFDILLARSSGQTDLLVGSPVANRNRAETEELIGFFVNTLVLRTDLGRSPDFPGLLRQVSDTVLGAYAHQDLPFEVLVEELRPERDLSRSPFFQVLLSLQTLAPLPRLGDLELSQGEAEIGSAKFDLSLFVTDTAPALRLTIEHNTALFEAATADRFLGHFQRLLEEVVENPERSWRDLPLLTEAERQELLVRWNDTGATIGPDVCLHQLFGAQAAKTPGRVALVAEQGSLTYGELDRRADRLARRLRALGLGPERLAGVLLDRTPDLVVALLAVLKAGGAYAPLDPKYPLQRTRLVLETARATVLVTRRPLVEALAGDLPAGPRTVCLEDGGVDWGIGLPAVDPGNLAYVIFTSGSTGVPKGVAIPHRNAVAMVRWATAFYGPEDFAGLLASTSICFDMSVFEIFATLAVGGRIVLAENALALPELAARGEVTLVDTVPSAMAELLRLGGLPPTLRTVNLGGEPLRGSLVAEIHDRLPGVERVVNLYGPSEDTTFSTYSVVARGEDHPLIGRPLTGKTAFVLDSALEPVPVGVPGALYLGGEGVTRGYLHRPDMTAERYLPNPYGPPGSRMYAVGDLVSYRPTGELDFLGRLDHQVKVRGFRIELGEIESALDAHPEVREAAVLAFPEDLGGNRLVAFVATDLASPGELRIYLKDRLPDYMIPTAFVGLPGLPLTPNGKIDRLALARLSVEDERPTVENAGRAPESAVEQALVQIWSEIFGHPVRLEDDFFALGGHSLIATRVVSRLRTALGVVLPLQQIFALPVLEDLAVWVAKAVPAPVSAPTATPADARPERVPLSFAQQRLWFLEQLEPGTATFNLPAPQRLSGPLDPAVLARAVSEIARRHESLRTRFGKHEGRAFQDLLPVASVPLPWIDLTALPPSAAETEAVRLADAESRRPFDLARGPLLRVSLVRLAAEDWVLLVNMHHIVTDGWSVDVFFGELWTLYEAFQGGRPSPLPELPLQYPDFAAGQRRTLDAEAVSALLETWKERMGTGVPPLELPTDRPRPAVQTYPGAHRFARLPKELARSLQALSQATGGTLFMTLLAAFETLLHRYTGQERIVVGSPVAGRNRPDLEGLIGFFVNTLVLPGDFPLGLTFREVLERTRDRAWAAYETQDLPFDKLVEALQPVRDKSRSPLFQVMFLLGQDAGGAGPVGGGGGVTAKPFDTATGTSQFDLTLYVSESPEGLETGVEYNTDLFDADTMDRLLEHYGSLLSAVAARPEIRVEELAVPPLTRPAPVPVDALPAAKAPEASVESRRDRLSSRMSKLSPAQRAALERRLKGDAGPAAAATAEVPAGKCLVEIVPGSGRPFFCIHPAGGDVLCFFPLARHIGQPFYGLQARGLEDEGEPFVSIEDMAAHYLREIRAVQPSGPYRIGGWSFGGLAAFELARQLREAGEEVEILVVLDTAPGVEDAGAPDDPPAGATGDETGWLLTIAEYIKGLRGQDLQLTAADLKPLEPEAQLELFVERLKRAGVTHGGDSLSQLRRLLRVFKTNVRAYRRYVPRPYEGAITLIRAEGADFDPALGPDLGWEKLTPHPVDRLTVPGDHITLLAEPHVRVLADRLRALLGNSERP